MFPVGLAAVDQGYYGAAPAYWKAKELEQSQEAMTLLGQTFMNMSGGGQPGGGMPGMIPGGTPLPQAGMPPGGPPGAPGGMPPGMPRAGSPPPNPGAPLTNPGAPLVPTIGGPGGAPGGGAPAAAPGPTGPSPAMPPQAGPGPTPQMPFPAGGPGGQPQPPPQITQALGPAPYDWRQVAQAIVQANPGASPAVVARAVTMMVPFMQQDSQQQWHAISAYLQQQRLDETTRSHQANEAAKQEGYALRGQEDTAKAERFERTFAEGQRKFEKTSQYREAEAARKDAMSAATLDKQDFDRKYSVWRQKQNQADKFMRDEINARANLTGAERKQALAKIDEQRAQSERDMDEVKEQLPDRAQQGTSRTPPAGKTQPSPPGSSASEFGGRFTGSNDVILEAQRRIAADPSQKAAIVKKLKELGYDTTGL